MAFKASHRSYADLSEGANFIVFTLDWQALGRNLADPGIVIGIVE
jgi:hypothetical protein